MVLLPFNVKKTNHMPWPQTSALRTSFKEEKLSTLEGNSVWLNRAVEPRLFVECASHSAPGNIRYSVPAPARRPLFSLSCSFVHLISPSSATAQQHQRSAKWGEATGKLRQAGGGHG